MTNNVIKAIVLAGCLFLASCSLGSQEGSPPSSPIPVQEEDAFWASVWSADAGIDLFSRAGELVRGTVEAGYMAQAFGVKRSFPGYLDALGGEPLPAQNDPRRQAIAAAYAPPDLGPGAPNLKSLFYHVVELTNDNSRVSAKICEYGLLPTPSMPLRYLGMGEAVTLVKHDGPVGRPGIPDTGKNSEGIVGKIPGWNIFGSWRITESRGLRGETLPAQCTAWWKSVFPEAIQDPGRNSVQLPGLAPAAAGEVQYPKWIGPSNSE
ncbi:hypothetical protein [Williamsia sp. D3]|uniref:hypothetical protein n=1 Tax=Williamsia sp. D3 TaxID=1313067 RepID=UPI00126954D1|nr:hypothetical protein [Williamsia sp. D3]